MIGPTLLLVAHGTRDPRGVAVVHELAAAVREQGAVPVCVAFVDVVGPTVSEALSSLDGPVVVVPAFLAAGYHVYTDVPREVRASRYGDVRVTPALGPDRALAVVQHARLGELGWRPGEAVVLAAVGSTDPRALADVAEAGRQLAAQLGTPVRHGYAATAEPTVAQVMAEARVNAAGRVIISPYLLAPGLFQAKLGESGADALALPMGAHPLVVELVLQRYRDAVHGLDGP